MLFQPAFDNYASVVLLAGPTPVYINLTFWHLQPDENSTVTRNGLQLGIYDLDPRRYHHTHMAILNSPHNPTGNVIARHKLEGIEHATVGSTEKGEVLLYRGLLRNQIINRGKDYRTEFENAERRILNVNTGVDVIVDHSWVVPFMNGGAW